MPELPEAEVVVRQLRARLIGATLASVWIGRDDIVREGLPSREWYPGTTLVGVERRGKSVVLAFTRSSETRYLVAELGMTGLLLFRNPSHRYEKHIHTRFVFAGGQEPELAYWNPRRFGRLALLDGKGLQIYTGRRFGLEPLAMTWDDFWLVIKRRRVRLKPFLMHQQAIAGIGNIYANEILFRAGLHPHKRTHRVSMLRGRELYRQIQAVLTEAIEDGGSSIRDFLAPDGTPGRYAMRHLVYDQGAQPCPARCGGLIRVLKGERTSFYCPRCQRV